MVLTSLPRRSSSDDSQVKRTPPVSPVALKDLTALALRDAVESGGPNLPQPQRRARQTKRTVARRTRGARFELGAMGDIKFILTVNDYSYCIQDISSLAI